MELVELISMSAAVGLSVVGAEVLKKKIMDWIFPPPEPIFGYKEKQTLLGIVTTLGRVKSIVEEIPTSPPTLTEEEHKALMDLENIHDVKDQDGIPLWYVPRSWQKTQEETLKATQEIAFAQKETATALEGVMKVIERLADRIADMRR